jgi:hypothetical protein
MKDTLSEVLRLLTSVLGATHPMRLLLALSGALGVKTAVTVLSKTYAVQPWTALDEFAAAWYILLIVPLFFAPVVLGRRGAPETAVHQVNTVRLLLQEAGFRGAQQQMIWRALIDKYLKAVQPDLSEKPRLASMLRDAVAETQETSGNTTSATPRVQYRRRDRPQ